MREEAIRTTKIRQLNLPPPLLVQSGSRTEDVIAQMRKGKTTCALICKGDRCIGIFTERDFLDKILDKKGDSSLPVDSMMSRDPQSLTPEDSVESAIRMMNQFGYRNIPLRDREGKSVGLVQIRNIIDFLAELYPEEVLNKPPRDNQKFSEPDGA
ncbi:MAG TPA: CBS domain-containing protein [Acidobacteriota bacterium]|nr:CBS domain-containing protein [Acidobacteriota bacterium]